ncbi:MULTISPECIES: NADP-dependent oxidoreductase [Streptomyces]|uniref:NADP-dependent oxidoreductase n=1 Tax=Streptomyces TaxID=1883 RepID=UPI0016729FE2|nr:MULTISPECIES: NADP-dependent oxidoreductase [Streptomyces]MBD3575577.1 NADP-dependent oxidoreductase [Streptomyces sp. KD18]GGT21830.1 NADPH:quinone reductase [Streptomyces toxytricini]
MRAVVFDRFGGPEVLHEAEQPVPSPGRGQIRVRVRAAGVNPVDAKIRSGAMEHVFPTTLPSVLGSEFAGTVDALGEGVEDVAVGEEVLGWADSGAYAEFALASRYAAKPRELSWPEAASLPVAGDAARRVLRRLAVAEGETLLIHGATGGVGTMAVQLAVRQGVRVIGTAGAANLDYLASLGAIPTRYGPGLVERVRALAPGGLHAVFDAAGKGALSDSVELLGGTDRIVTIADFTAPALGVAFEAGPQLRDPADLAALARQAASGKLTVTVAATYPLADAALAHEAAASGHTRGKRVLTLP